MTENQNNKGRGISILILTLIVLLGFLSSCTSLRTAPSNTIKVLAVTTEGDTIQLDVNSLRPRVYQNIYHTYPYFYNYWRPSAYYNWGWGNNYYIRPNSSRPNINIPNVVIPSKPTGTYNQPSTGTGVNIVNPSLVSPPNPGATNPKKNN
jgi:hypothetical protein